MVAGISRSWCSRFLRRNRIAGRAGALLLLQRAVGDGSRAGALVMRAAPSGGRDLMRPKLAAITVTGCHMILVICDLR